MWQLDDDLNIFKFRVLSQAMMDLQPPDPNELEGKKTLRPPLVREAADMFK
jgi:hypothetical protein